MQYKAFIQRAVGDMEKQTRAEHLQIEIDRLDKLQEAVWDAAISGDVKAVDSVLKIINLRTKLLGLDTVTTEIDARHQTVVIANDGDFVKSLKAIAGETDE
jgi:hypothetical protein